MPRLASGVAQVASCFESQIFGTVTLFVCAPADRNAINDNHVTITRIRIEFLFMRSPHCERSVGRSRHKDSKPRRSTKLRFEPAWLHHRERGARPATLIGFDCVGYTASRLEKSPSG